MSSPTRRPCDVGRRPSNPNTPTSSPASRRYAQRRPAEDPNVVVIDLSGNRDKLPRPAADLSAEALYAHQDSEQQECSTPGRSPSQRREQAAAREKNAGKQFLWPTLDCVYLKSDDLASTVPLPLAVVCAPFADGAGDSTTLPLSEVGAEEPVRCPRCKAYVNSYCKWIRGEPPRLTCNMCDHSMEVPEPLREDMERAGQCADEDNHPELVFGSVDFTAQAYYDVDKPATPTPPALCFVLETSADAVGSGFVDSSLCAIYKMLESEGCVEEPALVERRVCFITFDQAVHFFAPTKSGRFQAITMQDLEDPYVPLGSQAIFVDPSSQQGRARLLELLQHLKETLTSQSAALPGTPLSGGCASPAGGGCEDAFGGAAGGAALRVAVEALSQVGGGDVLMFHATDPSTGGGVTGPDPSPFFGAGLPGSNPASPMPSPKRGGGVTPSSATAASSPKARRGSGDDGPADLPRLQQAFYKDVLALCVRGGVAVSCITAPAPGLLKPIDVSTLQWLPCRTGGETLHLPSFTTACFPLLSDTLQFWAEKMQASAYGCVVRVRCSKGLACKSLIAAWPAAPSSPDGSAFEISRLSPDVSFAFTLQTEPEPENHDEPFYRRDTGRKQLFIQVASLYTNSKGERLLRVHTCIVNVMPSIRPLYQHVNIAPLITLLVKQAAALALERKPKDLPRDCLLEFCLQAIAAYTRHCQACEMRQNVLLLGKKLQLLPLYILAARKLFYIATSGTQDRAQSDDFSRRLLKMPTHSLLAALYPRVYALPCAGHEGAALPPAGQATKEILLGGRAPAYLVASAFGTWFYQTEAPEPQRREEAPGAEGPHGGKAEGGGATPAEVTPERTPETKPVDRAELWSNAEALSQRLRESLAPCPAWMPLGVLPRLPGKQAGDVEIGWADKIFLSALFVEDEGVTEMEYAEWVHFIHGQVARMLD